MNKIIQFLIRCMQSSVLNIVILLIFNFCIYSFAEHGDEVGDVDEITVSNPSSKTFIDLLNPNNSHLFQCEKITEYATGGWSHKTYFDNQNSNAYTLDYNGTKYSFAIIQRDPPGTKGSQIWAVSKDYRAGKNPQVDRIAVQITDFIGMHKMQSQSPLIISEHEVGVDYDGELDAMNGVYYVHTREDYVTKHNYLTYIANSSTSTVIAVNI